MGEGGVLVADPRARVEAVEPAGPHPGGCAGEQYRSLVPFL